MKTFFLVALLSIGLYSCNTKPKETVTTDIAVTDKPVITETSTEVLDTTSEVIQDEEVEITLKEETTEVAATEAVAEVAPESKVLVAEKMSEKENGVKDKMEEKISEPIEEPQTENSEVAQEVEEIAQADTTPEITTPKIAKPLAPNHTDWNAMLKKYVDNAGNVNYAGFKTESSRLQVYLDQLAKTEPQSSWSKNEKLAYYINLYNAATVKLIVDNYPLKSIKDIPNRWKKNWIKVGNTTTSLNDIEHEVLRKMNEPRIHFAINCASYSCPKLLNVAFTKANMESLLEKSTKEFVNDPTRNTLAEKKVKLSQIFKWFKKDFTTNGSIADYIKRYSNTPLAEKVSVGYIDYDWSLNEAK